MKKEKDEVQSRRDFFKMAAKAALPIIATVVLASNPVVAKAASEIAGSCVCSGTCSGTCRTGCSEGSCKHNCISSCKNGCYTGCKTTCKNGAQRN